MSSIPERVLNDGRRIPAIGFGTNEVTGSIGRTAITSAIDLGYRLIDTARNYRNERDLGIALRFASVDRGQLFISTKIPGRYHGFDETITGLHKSLDDLGLDYVDLLLIHWPLPRIDKYVDSWKAMIELRDRGLVRSIGVSNFTQKYLQRLIDETGVTPAVNQIELHPYFPQPEMRAFHQQHGIVTQSWSPIGKKSDLLAQPEVADIAGQHAVTPAQVVLRWQVQLGSIPIPKALDARHQAENLQVFDWSLTDAEVERLSGLERGRLWGGDPVTKEEF